MTKSKLLYREFLFLFILISFHFPAKPCLYQEIRERGLHSTNQDELLEDFVVVEPPEQDQGIVMKSYKQAHLTWSQLPQVNLKIGSAN